MELLFVILTMCIFQNLDFEESVRSRQRLYDPLDKTGSEAYVRFVDSHRTFVVCYVEVGRADVWLSVDCHFSGNVLKR